MIEIKNISFSYGDREILKNINFNISKKELVAVLGNNGAGKSTLITCLNKIKTPKSGNTFIDGINLSKINLKESAKLISYVAQKNELNQITVFDSVLLGRKPYIKWSVSGEDLNICNKLIEQIGFADYKLRYLNQLSGGEVQKVMLARALAQQPKLLLLDEPTSNLDPKNQYEMLSLVKKEIIKRDISAIIVLHDINLALRYCDKFLFLNNSEIYCYGGSDVVTEKTIEEVYGIKSFLTDFNGRKTVIFECE